MQARSGGRDARTRHRAHCPGSCQNHVMDVARYLDRVGVRAPVEPTPKSLETLQRAHLSTVPFENLHVYHRRGVFTTDDWTVPKIVDQRRGGWCFELNGAFAALLTALGYDVRRLAATVLGDNPSPMPTHLTLQVTVDRPYLVDVGFGDSFIKPLPLDSDGPHDGGLGRYHFIREQGTTTLASTEHGKTVSHYRFTHLERSPADFEEASLWLQTEPGLRWTETRFATRLLDGGPDRVTLLEDRIRFRHGGRWTEHPVTSADWPYLLNRWFAMTP